MCNEAKCCNSLASSPNGQLIYVFVCIAYVCAASLGRIPESNYDFVENPQPSPLIELVLLGAFVIWFVALSSRCCAPCCCGTSMPDVSSPCPPGPWSWENLKLLDYPMLIAFGGDFFSAIYLNMFFLGNPGGSSSMFQEALRTYRLVSMLWIGLAILGVVAGIKKYKLLKERQSSRMIVPLVGLAVSGPPASGAAAIEFGAY